MVRCNGSNIYCEKLVCIHRNYHESRPDCKEHPHCVKYERGNNTKIVRAQCIEDRIPIGEKE